MSLKSESCFFLSCLLDVTLATPATLGLGILCSNLSWLCYASVLTKWLYYAFPTVSLCLNCTHSQVQDLLTVVYCSLKLNWPPIPLRVIQCKDFVGKQHPTISFTVHMGRNNAFLCCIVLTRSMNTETGVTIYTKVTWTEYFFSICSLYILCISPVGDWTKRECGLWTCTALPYSQSKWPLFSYNTRHVFYMGIIIVILFLQR